MECLKKAKQSKKQNKKKQIAYCCQSILWLGTANANESTEYLTSIQGWCFSNEGTNFGSLLLDSMHHMSTISQTTLPPSRQNVTGVRVVPTVMIASAHQLYQQRCSLHGIGRVRPLNGR